MTQREDCLNQAVAHYERMIEWAKTQHPDAPVDSCLMQESINETWHFTSCMLCRVYCESEVKCPLSDRYCDGTCIPEWGALINTYEWGDWIPAADKVLKALRSKLCVAP